jgi:hypothetical protein
VEGDRVGLGRALTRLAVLTKQIGTPEGENTWDRAAEYGRLAVQVLREADNPRALAAALRAAAMPFVSGVDPTALLNESIEISRSCGDTEGEAWAQYALATNFRVAGARERSTELFEATGNPLGLARNLLSEGIGERNHSRRRKELLFAAHRLFEKSGDRKAEWRSCYYCSVFLSQDLGELEMRALLERAVELSGDAHDRYFSLRMLARHFRRFGRQELLRECEGKSEALIPELFGTYADYLAHEISETEEALSDWQPRWTRASTRTIRMRLRRMKSELRKIQQAPTSPA